MVVTLAVQSDATLATESLQFDVPCINRQAATLCNGNTVAPKNNPGSLCNADAVMLPGMYNASGMDDLSCASLLTAGDIMAVERCPGSLHPQFVDQNVRQHG